MAGYPFPIDPVLTGVVISYSNAALVADMVLPRLSPALARREFKWTKFDFGQFLDVPDTQVGRKGVPNEVEITGTEVDSSVLDYALDDVVPADDVVNAPAGYDPLATAAMVVMDKVLLDREIRVAGMVLDANAYASSNKETLSGTDQWSHASSNPIEQITTAANSMVMRPNVMVTSLAGWTALSQNPKIVSAINRNEGTSGIASRRAVAELLELQEIVVGEAWKNTARKGQTASLSRIWGTKALLFRREPLARSLNGQPTFGGTFQYGTRVASQIPEPKTGMRGATRVRAGESVKEVIMAADLGYLFTDVV